MRASQIAEHVVETAADIFGLEVALLRGRSRTREIAAARSAVYYVLHKVCPQLSMQTIAEFLNQVDRKSVYNGIERCEQYMQQSAIYRKQVERLLAPFVAPPPQRRKQVEQHELIVLWAHLHHGSAFVKSA